MELYSRIKMYTYWESRLYTLPPNMKTFSRYIQNSYLKKLPMMKYHPKIYYTRKWNFYQISNLKLFSRRALIFTKCIQRD